MKIIKLALTLSIILSIFAIGVKAQVTPPPPDPYEYDTYTGIEINFRGSLWGHISGYEDVLGYAPVGSFSGVTEILLSDVDKRRLTTNPNAVWENIPGQPYVKFDGTTSYTKPTQLPFPVRYAGKVGTSVGSDSVTVIAGDAG